MKGSDQLIAGIVRVRPCPTVPESTKYRARQIMTADGVSAADHFAVMLPKLRMTSLEAVNVRWP